MGMSESSVMTSNRFLGDVVTAGATVAAADPQYVFVWTVIERRDVVRKQPILHVVVGAIAM